MDIIDIFTLVKMFQGRDITSHSKNASQSAGSFPFFSLFLSITPPTLESPVTQHSVFKQDEPKGAGDVRVLLGFAENLITP